MELSVRNIASLIEVFLVEYSKEQIYRSENADSNGHGEKSPGLDDEAIRKVQVLFLGDLKGKPFLENLDEILVDYPDLIPVGEYIMDMAVLRLLVQFDDSDTQDDYFETSEWLEIEEQLDERGSELLNVLVYLKDCLENKAKPSLRDFLNEFLLVQEEDFQEEFEIYEPFIRNNGILQGRDEDIIEIGNNLENEAVADLFTPLMLFFKYEGQVPGETFKRIERESEYPGLDAALLKSLQHFMSLENHT